MLPRAMDLLPLEDVVLPFCAPRGRVPLARAFKSTWLASSLRALRERGLHERYVTALTALAPSQAETIASAVAGTWLPVSIAMAHYDACDRLDMPTRDQVAMGVDVMRHTHRTVLSVAMRLSSRRIATPWMIFGHAQRLWDRTWNGGAIGVFRTGEREVRMELLGWPCARFTYCRAAMRGIIIGFTEPFCEKVHAVEIPALHSPTSMGYRVAWV